MRPAPQTGRRTPRPLRGGPPRAPPPSGRDRGGPPSRLDDARGTGEMEQHDHGAETNVRIAAVSTTAAATRSVAPAPNSLTNVRLDGRAARVAARQGAIGRSEERRVGKECR